MSRNLRLLLSVALLAGGLVVIFNSPGWGILAANAYLRSQGGGMDTGQFLIVVQESIEAYRWAGLVVAALGGLGLLKTLEGAQGPNVQPG